MFEHQRHKPPNALAQAREIVVIVPQLRSKVNLSRIVRAAGCCGIRHVIACGRATIDPEIVRDALDFVDVERHRSLLPQLTRLRGLEFRLVGLEQATQSVSLYDYSFERRTALVLGHERHGILPEMLKELDDVVEIPVYGRPQSHNVATAAAIAFYEYCRQFPLG